MEIKFQTDALRLLFEDSFFRDKDVGIKATKHYRLIVNLILSAGSRRDLENMRFLNLKPPTTEIQHHTADIDEKRILIMDLTDDCAEIVGILNKELS